MSDQKKSASRRDLIKVIVIGGVATSLMMPNRWSKPIIEAIAPPAHAAASAPATTLPPPG